MNSFNSYLSLENGKKLNFLNQMNVNNELVITNKNILKIKMGKNQVRVHVKAAIYTKKLDEVSLFCHATKVPTLLYNMAINDIYK
jgi:hypothetical protein